MRNTLIVYYSRTGTTRRLATALAERLGADMAEIHCPRYRPGMLRYLRAGYDSVKGNLPPIEAPKIEARTYELVLLGAPVWTSHPALPLRAFLAHAPLLPARVGLFLTYGGHSAPDVAIRETEQLVPGGLVASLALNASDVGTAAMDPAIATFAGKLAGLQAA